VLPLARPDWSRKLPRPLKIPTITTLRTPGDIRAIRRPNVASKNPAAMSPIG
jgi:hypothetical protein